MVTGLKKSGFTAQDIFFSAAWFIYVVSALLSYTVWAFTESGDLNTFGKVLKYSHYFTYLLCAISILLFTKLTVKTVARFIAFIALCAATVVFSGNRYAIFIALLILAFYGQPEERLLTISFVSTFVITAMMVILSKVGVVQDFISNSDDRVRHFLGFSWATYSAIVFLFMILEFLAIKRGRVCLREYIIWMIFNVFFFLETDTRFSFLIGTAALTFFLIFGRRLNTVKHKKWYNWFLLSPWVIAFFSIFIHWAYNPDSAVWRTLNTLLSSRLSFADKAFQNFDITLFGQPIEWVGYSMRQETVGEYNYIDCSYLRILFAEGIVFLILLLLLITMIMKLAIDRKKYYLVWILFFILIFGITEQWVAESLAVNPFLLCICAYGTKEPCHYSINEKLNYTSNRLVLK